MGNSRLYFPANVSIRKCITTLLTNPFHQTTHFTYSEVHAPLEAMREGKIAATRPILDMTYSIWYKSHARRGRSNTWNQICCPTGTTENISLQTSGIPTALKFAIFLISGNFCCIFKKYSITKTTVKVMKYGETKLRYVLLCQFMRFWISWWENKINITERVFHIHMFNILRRCMRLLQWTGAIHT